MSDQPLWSPSPERIAHAGITAFMKLVSERHGVAIADYASLHAWSVANLEDFWRDLWDYAGVIGERGARVLVDANQMPGARFLGRDRHRHQGAIELWLLGGERFQDGGLRWRRPATVDAP